MATIDLATAAQFRLGPILGRPSFRERVQNDGQRAILEPRVMEVLVALASGEGIFGRHELVDRCWGGRAVSEDAIKRIISRVRRVSEGIGASAFGLETITKV